MPTATPTRPDRPATLEHKEFQGRIVGTKAVDAGREEDYIREALVAVTGNTDDGGDVIEPGAFQFKRHPKVVWSHDLRTLVGKVLEYEELLPGSSKLLELAPDLAAKGLGALWFKVQFDPLDDESLRAFRKVDFHDDLGWSIGYETPTDGFKVLKDGRRSLKTIYVWEASPTTFGMNLEARTVSVKSLIEGTVEDLALPQEKARVVQDALAAIVQIMAPEEESYPAIVGSYEETQTKLQEALRAWASQVYDDPGPENDYWVSIEGTFEDRVVATIRFYSGQGENVTMSFPWTEDEDGSVLLGEGTEVEVQATVTDANDQTPPPPAEDDGLEESAADLDLDPKALTDAIEEVKKGAVLSAANASALRQAVEAISAVLAKVEKDEADKKKGEKAARTVRPQAEQDRGEKGAEVLNAAEFLEMLAQT